MPERQSPAALPNAAPDRRAMRRLERTRRRLATLARHPPRYEGLGFDFGISVALLAVGYLIHSDPKPDEGVKVSLTIMLGVVEILYIFGRLVVSRLSRLADDSLAVIPRQHLSNVLHRHFDTRRVELLDRAHELATRDSCQLDKTEMYRELIGLTRTVTSLFASHAVGTVLAVSSTNIEDFNEEPLATQYLAANEDAVQRNVQVWRIFLLDKDEADDPEIISIIHKHHNALRGPGGNAGVKWILKADVPEEDQEEDFALFGTDALVSQLAGGNRFGLTQNQAEIVRALTVFQRLWAHPAAREVHELRDTHRQ